MERLWHQDGTVAGQKIGFLVQLVFAAITVLSWDFSPFTHIVFASIAISDLFDFSIDTIAVINSGGIGTLFANVSRFITNRRSGNFDVLFGAYFARFEFIFGGLVVENTFKVVATALVSSDIFREAGFVQIIVAKFVAVSGRCNGILGSAGFGVINPFSALFAFIVSGMIIMTTSLINNFCGLFKTVQWFRELSNG